MAYLNTQSRSNADSNRWGKMAATPAQEQPWDRGVLPFRPDGSNGGRRVSPERRGDSVFRGSAALTLRTKTLGLAELIRASYSGTMG